MTRKFLHIHLHPVLHLLSTTINTPQADHIPSDDAHHNISPKQSYCNDPKMADTTPLTAKTAEAAYQYALKNYVQAAELYSQASELQHELNGEMAPENAELLYAYGRCLYKVAVEKSDVLGNRVAGPAGGEEKRGRKRKAMDGEEGGSGSAKVEKNGGAKGAAASATTATAAGKNDNAPYFQIEGDDADWDSDESGAEVECEGEDAGEDANGDGAAQEEEEEDDLAVAYEVLDIARVLLERRVKAAEECDTNAESTSTTNGAETANTPTKPRDKGKGKATLTTPPSALSPKSPELTHLYTLLSDTYDLQSEINLENEQFPLAASDAKSSLSLKTRLHSPDDPVLAEAYFKVSLALEFAAKTTSEKPDELTGEMKKEVEGVDEDMLKESAVYMEKAVESTKARITKEEAELASSVNMDAAEKTQKQKKVDEVKEILADMVERLKELRTPVTAALSTAALADPSNPGRLDEGGDVMGLLGALLGEAPAVVKQKIAEASKNANDLTGMVRRGGRRGAAHGNANGAVSGAANGSEAAALPSQGKRKAGGDVAGSSKKARVEDAEDELA